MSKPNGYATKNKEREVIISPLPNQSSNYASRFSKSKVPFTRINQRIRASEVRCLNTDGSQAGVMSLSDALRLAEQAGLDLVEVNPNSDPPVCRVMDYGKFKYEEGQRKKIARKSQAKTVVKEVKFHVNVEENDYQLKLRNIRSFLEEGCKVKLTLQFRGRENAHKELGLDVMNRVCKDLGEEASVEQSPRIMGRTISGMLGPGK